MERSRLLSSSCTFSDNKHSLYFSDIREITIPGNSTFQVECINSADLLYNYEPMEVDLSDIAETLFPCVKCNKQFKSRVSLQHHIHNYHKTTYPCPSCPKIYDNRRALAHHQKTNHPEDNERSMQQPKNLTSDDSKQLDNPENTLSCKCCGRKFAFQSVLSRHVKHCDGSVHPCLDCDKVFGTKSLLLHHVKIHSTEQNYTCTNCQKVFINKLSFRRHIRHKVCTELFKKCEICGESFRSTSLALHKRTHLNDGSNACLECGDRFDNKVLLDSHVKQAHPDRFTCTICSNIFASQYMLQRHIKAEHSFGNVFCDQCGKEFRAIRSLEDHVATFHCSTFNCTECSQSFNSYDLLYAHRILEHRGQGNILCDLCPKVLKTQGNFFQILVKAS